MYSVLLKKIIKITDPPIINNITWDDDNQYEQSSYVMTIDATDPQGLNISYSVTCDDPNITITQDTNNPNVFNVTYPQYSSTIDIKYTVVVTSETQRTSFQEITKTVSSFSDPPVINNVRVDSDGSDNNYLITINISNPGGSTLTYNLICDDSNVTITQDTTDENKFHVVLPSYSPIVSLNFVASITNTNNSSVTYSFNLYSPLHGDLAVMVGGWGPSGGTDTMDQITLTTPGNATSFGSYGEPVSTITGYFSNGLDERGILGGTMNTNTNNIISNKYITINSPGNANYFGENIVVEKENSGVSNNKNQRGVFMAGIDQSGNYLQSMGYVTINSPGNATNFGQLLYSRAFSRSASNGINDRGIMAAGVTTTSFLNNIEYITISTPGNSTNFGGLATNTKAPSSFSNGLHDRAIIASGGTSLNDWSVFTGDMQYLTITTPGNAVSFNTTTHKSGGTGGSNGTGEIGLVAGGWQGSYHLSDIVTYRIDTLSSDTYFGELTVARDPCILCDA